MLGNCEVSRTTVNYKRFWRKIQSKLCRKSNLVVWVLLHPPTFAEILKKNMTFKRFKYILIAAFSVFCLFISNTSQAQHSEAIEPTQAVQQKEAVEKEFNITETIMEHIQDNYSWHILGHTSLPLPVILFTPNGTDVFMSSKLVDHEHHPIVYTADKNSYKLIEGKVHIVNADGTVNEEAQGHLYDFSITKNVFALLISASIILLIFLSVAKAYKKRGVTSAPKGLQSFMEPVVLFVKNDVAKPAIGHNYGRYMPLLLTIFFLILFNNFLGLIPFLPGGANLSGNIAFTMCLALIIFIVTNINGNKHYWQHIFWMPGMHWAMKLFLAPIELVGVFVKPISLMIRLFANITAGHVLVLSLLCLIFIFKAISAAAIAVPFAVFISLIEVLVAFLQAFIFTMLSAMYIGAAIEEHHHAEHH